MSETPSTVKRSRYHGWFPRNLEVHKAFIKEKVTKAIARKEEAHTEPVHTEPVERFSNGIYSDPALVDLFEQVFLQVNTNPQRVDPKYVVKDLETLFHLLDVVVNEAPAYYNAERADGTTIGEPIGVPLLLVFDMFSNTSAAYDLFRNPSFNAYLKELLDHWGAYLTSDASNSTLTTGAEGWFSTESMAGFQSYIQPLSFDETYVCPDPSAENKGFASWDAFFTRKLQPNARPITDPDDLSLIHNACESTTLRCATNVQLHDKFWIKDQSYSLYDILDRSNADAELFAGGTVYQAFLSPLDYHRWHSPVKGKVLKTYSVPGSYYAALPDSGAPAGDLDFAEGDPHGALIRSQAWLTVNATRAIIFIEADNADIGLMCFIGVGMAEVSTCEIMVQEGQQVVVGDELGMFHFGGSTHVLLFRPEVGITFEDQAGEPVEENNHYWVNTVIGKVAKN